MFNGEGERKKTGYCFKLPFLVSMKKMVWSKKVSFWYRRKTWLRWFNLRKRNEKKTKNKRKKNKIKKKKWGGYKKLR